MRHWKIIFSTLCMITILSGCGVQNNGLKETGIHTENSINTNGEFTPTNESTEEPEPEISNELSDSDEVNKELMLNYMSERYGEEFHFIEVSNYQDKGKSLNDIYVTADSLAGTKSRVHFDHGQEEAPRTYSDDYAVIKYANDLVKGIYDTVESEYFKAKVFYTVDHSFTIPDDAQVNSFKDLLKQVSYKVNNCLIFIRLGASDITESIDQMDDVRWSEDCHMLIDNLSEKWGNVPIDINIVVTFEDVFDNLSVFKEAEETIETKNYIYRLHYLTEREENGNINILTDDFSYGKINSKGGER